MSIEAADFERFIGNRFRKGDRNVDVDTVRKLIDYADAVR